MLETYITPLLMSYVDKYIKNLKPSDLSLSIWGGDVVLYNLELRLDVLEKELKLPITFLSGKIHKLQIHVPWTKLVSEPVNITINTIECVIELKDPTVKHDDMASPLSASEVKKELDEKNLHDRGEPPPAGYVQSLVNRVANNISICIHNVVLKYVEDDIVLSLNVKSAETFSVNANWEKAFVDIIAPDYILRKVCNISDLTVCLDKKSTSGKIDMYQDPILYKCGLSCRININYDAQLRPKSTKLNVYCESFDLSLTDEQLPLFVRLNKLCILLYYNTLDLPGCDYKQHPASNIMKDNNGSPTKKTSISSDESRTNEDNAVQMHQSVSVPQDDWYNWMWSFIPEATTDEALEETKTQMPDLLLTLGIYISQVTLTLKLTSKVSERTFFGAQRYQFKPLLSCELSGVALEAILHGEEFFDAQGGVTSIMGWTLGDCSCYHSNKTEIVQSIQESEEDDLDEKEDMFLSVRAPHGSPTEPQGFLLGSLFYTEETSLKPPEIVFEQEAFLEQYSESFALKRYGAFFFDYLYIMDIEPVKDDDGEEEEHSGLDYVGKIRLVKEASHKRIFLGSLDLQLTAGLIHRLSSIHEFSSDGSPDRKEKDMPFYDEFVEKQLLAGNISSRHITVTLLSVNLTIPAADHIHAGSFPSTTSRSEDPSLKLQSIPEKKARDDQSFQPALVILINRMEIHRNNPMYPTELTKLIITNAEFPASKSMLHHAFNNSVVEIFSIEMSISHTIPDSALINIMPSVSAILSVKDCILPDTWKNETLKRIEICLEVPSLSLCLTKAQFLLLSHLFVSWSTMLMQNKRLPVLHKAVIGSIFDLESYNSQPELELNMSNIDIQCCSTSAVMATTSSVGTISAAIKSKGATELPDSEEKRTATLVLKGPCDTKEIYKGTLFNNSTYHEDQVENTGPVFSLTLQLPRYMEKQGFQGFLHNTETSNVVLLQTKGISVCCDPLLYEWLAYQPSAASSSGMREVEKDRRIRQASLTRSSSIGTPRKKSYARGSISSPSKNKVPQERSTESKPESTDGLTFEAWLFEKLPLITSFAVQVDIRSTSIFVPEGHVPQALPATSIAQNLAYQSWKGMSRTFPSTLVLCLPTLEIFSASHNEISFRPSLPVHLSKQTAKDSMKHDTLPWTVNAKNLAVYSVHLQSNHIDKNTSPVCHDIVSPLSCTAVLASAKTSTPSSPTNLSLLLHSGSRIHGGTSRKDGQKSPTLGFCVHADFEPIIVSSSRKQIKLLANLLESFFLTVVSPSSYPVDVCPPTSDPALQRRMSVTSSSSTVEQIEQESVLSHSESSFSFTQVHQTNQSLQDVKVSLWLQWTLPRFIVKLYSNMSSGNIPVCVTMDLEDLTAFIDYQETHLQMQYKVGAFNITHTMKRDSTWLPGPFGGILLSCKDILTYKRPPLVTSPRLPTTANQHKGPASGPHGFFNITYNRSSLHLKRQHSYSEKSGKESSSEECFKIQHEVRLSVQPFDVVLWSPIIVAGVDVFNPILLGKFKFLLREDSKPFPNLDKEAKDGNENVSFSVCLLPLLFMNMSDIRLFLPCSQIDSSSESLHEDLVIVHLSAVTATPHPENPIGRTVLNQDLHDKFRKFGRSSRHALGYDLHEVQYQMVFSGFGVWTTKWEELCGNLNKQGDLRSSPLMDQNPALEWNTQLWRSAKEVHVTPLLTGSDFKIVIAPATTMERTVTDVRNTRKSFTDSIPVCGCSVELNLVTNVDVFLSKCQIQLLKSLTLENVDALNSCELMSSPNQGVLGNADSKIAPQDGDHIDSGLGSTHTDAVKPSQKAIPFEAFLAARNITTNMYLQRATKRRRSQHGLTVPAKEESAVYTYSTKPVLQIGFLQPSVTYKDHSLGPHFQLWCFDMSILGSHAQVQHQGWLQKSLPEASDYNMECFRTGPGVPDPHTGVMPPLITVDARNLTNGAMNASIDVGRPLHLAINPDMGLEITRFFDDFTVHQSETPTSDPPHKSPKAASTINVPAVKFFNVTTRDISLELSMTPRDDCPKVLLGMSGNRGSMRIKYDEQGNFKRSDGNLETEGIEMSFLALDQLFYLVKPFILKCEIEMISSPHSLTQTIPSMPQICSRVSIGLLQFEFGQQHMNCIAALSKALQEFCTAYTSSESTEETSVVMTSKQTSDNKKIDIANENDQVTGLTPIRAEADLGFEILDEKDIDMENNVKEHGLDGVKQTIDDLRAGPFKYLMVSGEVGLHHPEPYEILFTTDTRERPPTMVWRYPEPRALSAVEVLPLPFTSPVLVNTLNMGDELRVPCVLSYWDTLQKCYIVYKEFYISETSSCKISLPDPLRSDPATVIVAEEWQMIVDASVEIDFSEDQSLVDEDNASSYSSPYRSLISATSLAASVKVDSVFSPSLIPAVLAQVSISIFEVKLLNHNQYSHQVLPKRFAGYTIDSSVPTEQEFCTLTIEGLSGVTKHLGGRSAVTLSSYEWNCHFELLDFGDLTYRTLVSPFSISATAAFHGKVKEAIKTADQRSVWLEAGVDIGSIESVVSQSTVHTLASTVDSWTKDDKRKDETTLFCHYIICNDTNEAIRLGQVDTDESILLSSKYLLPYSWRFARSLKAESKLHVCFEREGDWRWSEPIDIDSLGVSSRTIHHKLHSATLLIDVRSLSGVQKQVIFRGGLQIASRLSTGVDLQILQSPDIGSSHKEQASFQIHDDISLPPITTLPSYIVSNTGLWGVRIRIPNTTTWCEALPLDNAVGDDGKAHHVIVQLLGVKTFQTFYLWYSLEKTAFEQIQITLSPLFIMRSHLPDPILMNVFSAKTNSAASLEMTGRGHEEQLLHLAPNTWHHLTFQSDKCSKTSEPSVPLNSSLIELANKVNPNVCDEVDIPLDSLWPYCGGLPKEKDETSSVSDAHSPFVRYVVSRGNNKDADNSQKKSEVRSKVNPFPDVELRCRVIKKWHGLNTLIVDVIPWCLLINKTVSTIFIKDVEDEGEIEMSSGQAIAPFRFKGKIQFGTLVAGSSTISWSKPLSLPFSNEKKDSSAKEPNSPEESYHTTINIAHVSTSARPVAVTWTMTSQTCHGVRVLSVQEKFCFVNCTGKPLLVVPVMAASAKKIPRDVLEVEKAIQLPTDSRVKLPVSYWDIAMTSSVVLDKEGVASMDDITPVAFFALGEQDTSIKRSIELVSKQWSQVFLMNSDLPRSAVAIQDRDGRTTIPLAITTSIVSGITNVVVANDSSPRLIFYNDCPFTLQFGQATPPQSPSYQKGSLEKVIVVEQLEPFYEVPEIPAFGMTHYELPVMREWFKTSSEFQELPNIHIQALYNVSVAEISEDAEGRISHGEITEVPQGWSHGLDINSDGQFVVNLPGRGRVIVFVSKSRLCTAVRIQIYNEDAAAMELPSNEALPPSFDVAMNISKLEISLIDARNQRKPSEVLRTTVFGISFCNSPLIGHSDDKSVLSELTLTLNSFQLDNQLEGELFQFPVVLLANESFSNLNNTSSQRKPRVGTSLKPFLSIKMKYEPNMETTFLHSVLVSCEPITMFLEDTLVYRMVVLAESFLPPAQEHDLFSDRSFLETTLLLNECSSILNPLVIGKFDIQPVTIHLTLHASIKLFIGMEDTSLSLGHFHMSPVYAPTSAFAQTVFSHYMSSVMFKIGWVVGSLELLGNPAGLIRNFSQGLSDFFFLPYDGLTRGPGAFVSGMSQGVSSFVRHVSTGALTSVTNLASSISRNLDRLCMDEDHIRILEEQRCRRPTRLVTGITQGLSGFGLSLLGAVAGVVDQPIQGIQRANDVKQAASGVLTGVGKGLLGVVTKPIGGAMELVSQTGQGILQAAGLSQLPSRLHMVEDGLVISSRNSLLKYSWKVLHLKANLNILCVDATVVTTTGHDYSGALLLTNNMMYITSTDTDAIQQSFDLRNTVVQEDERDNRTIIVTSVLQSSSFDDYTSDNPETGDPERMKQFLLDAQMFAQASQADSSTDHSVESIFPSKLKLIIDPILRDSVISRFTTAKYKLVV